MTDLTEVYGIFAAILVAAGFFMYMGTIGIKGDKKEDQLHKSESQNP
jgi:hypothetical protein